VPLPNFPSLPRAIDIQTELRKIDTELYGLWARLSALQLERDRLTRVAVIPLSAAREDTVREWRNALCPTSTIAKIQAQARARTSRSHSCFSSATVHNRCSAFTQYSEIIQKADEILSAVGYSVFCRASLVMEHRAELAKCYCRRRDHWIQNNELLTRALMHIRPTFEFWPPEFPRESIQRNPEKVMELTAPDQPILSKFAQKIENEDAGCQCCCLRTV
jgi:hypothetical protein